nr:phosphatase PAP2 family protein [Nocardioides panaciterrulae]
MLPLCWRFTGRARPRLVGELAIVAALLVFYGRVRSLAAVRPSEAVAHGRAILDAEGAVSLRVEGAVNGWLTGQGLVRMLAVDYYQFLHLSVAMGVLAFCYVRRPALYRPARNALVLTNVVALLVFALYPAAPPRLLPGAGFVDSVARAGFGTTHGPIPADQYGALPSLHLAWATWVAVVGVAMVRRWWVRALLVAHPLLTAVVVVVTANHYVVDVGSGMLLGLVATWAVGLLTPGATRSARGAPKEAAPAAARPALAGAPVGAPAGVRASPAGGPGPGNRSSPT